MDTFERTYTLPEGRGEFTMSVVGHKQENGQTLSSTGLTLWRAAEYMNSYLLKRPWSSTGKSYNAMELGSGIGFNGILLSKLNVNGSTTLTDGDTDTLENLVENVERNGGGCEVKQLRWGVDKVERVWDMIIASDVIYVPNVVPLLFDVVTAGLSEVGVFVLAYARRNVKFEMVLEEAEKRGMVWSKEETGVDGENVWVFRKGEGLSEIIVKTRTGREIRLGVKLSDTVLKVKNKLGAVEGLVLPDKQILLMKGVTLENEKTLDQYGVVKGTTIFYRLQDHTGN
ncbi:hypothetical protein TL16_g08214 [Triparma laevis f. inornata]|uniref:Ubiquitin-like domain-containing protein n=1 Tax=Triparma laevis f. inornata TaxID=1714386 RepID=A0A9W7EJX3_9STRA|nr:hypothetical protein TL16_g08214 [Triparma laevis f. inornata]